MNQGEANTESKPAFELQVLGPLAVLRHGTAVDLSGKPALLVALLAASADDVVSVDALIDGLWGDSPPATARKAVQVNVSNARRVLGADFPLNTARGGYVIERDSLTIDADRFQAAVGQAAEAIDDSPRAAVDTLAQALGLWRGGAYAGFGDIEALRGPILRLNEERVRAKRLLFDARMRLGDHAEVVGELDAVATEHPYDEDLRGLHMLALYRSGRQTDALRAFDRTRQLLIDELGLEPSPELRHLHQQILEQDPALGPPTASITVPAGPLGVGHAVRGYELRQELSESAHGTVFRAYQASVGREVAIKIIGSDHANTVAFVKGFEAEAKTVALLEHPHIVPLYDFWRDPSGAFLVMQWPRAGSVADVLRSRPFEPAVALRVLDQIGSALAYAHRQGVFHRDLRPSSVLLDDEGNAYLADFGVASQAAGFDQGSALAYAAPEVLAGNTFDARADVYSLTLLANEMLTGRRPALGAQPAPVTGAGVHLPTELDGVLASGSALDPDVRYQRIEDLLRAIRQVFGADVTTAETAQPVDVRNPYKGLRAFGETDSRDFFGRDELVSVLAHRISSSRLVAVVGPSGSGKSSLVRAGLLPVVRERGFGEGRDVVIAEMFPGSYPFEELEAALTRVAVNRPSTLLADLLADERGLLRASKQILPDDDTDLLVVIDQFEELFSLTADETVRRMFLDNLVAVAGDERSRVRVVLTMRADFFDRPLAYPEFGEQLSGGLVSLVMPGHDELAQAIAGPAAGAGLELEAGLISIITRDVADEPGALPLMQYALTELADARSGRDLTIEAYERTGGVIGALSRRAEDIYQGLPEIARAVAEEIFVHLVAVDEDSDDTRRRVRRSELDSLGLNPTALETVIADYGSFRLLSFDHDPVTRGQTIEVAHEALIREWPRYRTWIDGRRESLIMQRRLQASAAEWEASNRNRGFLFAGGRLEHYEQWADTPEARLSGSERALLADSRTAESTRVRRERSRRRRVLSLVCSLAAIAGIVATIAVVQQRRAETATEAAEQATLISESEAARAKESALVADLERTRAETASEAAEQATLVSQTEAARATESALVADLERMRAQAASEVDTNASLAALLAAEAYTIDPSPASAGAIQRVLTGVDGRQATLTSGTNSYGGGGTLAADKNVLAVSGSDAVDVWDLDARSLLLRVEANFAALDLSPDGTLLAVDSQGSERIDIIDVGSGDVVSAIDEPGCAVVRFSPDGDRLAMIVDLGTSSGCQDVRGYGQLQIWDLSDPSRPQLEHVNTDAEVFNMWWSPDGSGYVSFTDDASLDFRDATTHQPSWTHTFDLTSGVSTGVFARPIAGLFGSDGGSIVVGAQFNEIAGAWLFTFDTETGEVIGDPASTVQLNSMNWWNEDETEIVGTVGPSGAVVLDLDRSIEVLPAPFENGNATWVAVDHERGRIVSAGFLGVEVSSIDGRSVLERRVGLTDEQTAAKDLTDGQIFGALSGDGERLLMSLSDPTGQAPVVEWDLSTNPPTIVGERPPGFAYDQGDSALLFEAAGVQVLDENLEQTGELLGYEPDRGPVAIWRASSDGSRSAPVRFSTSAVDIYDTASGQRIAETPAWFDPTDILFAQHSLSADGDYMLLTAVTSSGEDWYVVDTDTGEIVHSEQSDIRTDPWLAGRTIYSNIPGSFDLQRRDVETLAVVGPPLVGHTLNLNSMSDDVDSDRVVTQASTGNVRIWDRETGDQIGSEIGIGPQQPGSGMTTARDGDLIGLSMGREFAIWNYDIETWPALACEIAGRNMTQREWDDFGPQGAEYHVTCAQFPAGT